MKNKAYNFKDITGQKFNRLLVKEFSGLTKDQKALWKCICDCGKEVVVQGKRLRTGHTNSCGCYKSDICREKTKKMSLNNRQIPGEANWNIFYKECEYKAIKRGLSFNLSLNKFKEVSKQNCAYCNCEPSSKNRLKNAKTYSKNWIEQSWIYKNGLDRINSNLGYEENNIVACCEFCNRMKTDFTLDFFLKKIEEIYKHRINK